VGFSHGHDPFQPLLDGDPKALVLDDLVALDRPLCEGELHRPRPGEHSYPRVRVEPRCGLVGPAEDLRGSVRELDHPVVMVPYAASVKALGPVALSGVVLSLLGCAREPRMAFETPDRDRAIVTEVVDGDTIRVLLAGRIERLRLIGVDAPEVEHPDKEAECFGKQAASFTSRSLEGRSISLEFDVERRDRFGRLLAYIFRDRALFNRILVFRGFAVERAYPPNVTRQAELREAEEEARRDRRGLWAACRRLDRVPLR
jgi:micrococcal nuclease